MKDKRQQITTLAFLKHTNESLADALNDFEHVYGTLVDFGDMDLDAVLRLKRAENPLKAGLRYLERFKSEVGEAVGVSVSLSPNGLDGSVGFLSTSPTSAKSEGGLTDETQL